MKRVREKGVISRDEVILYFKKLSSWKEIQEPDEESNGTDIVTRV